MRALLLGFTLFASAAVSRSEILDLKSEIAAQVKAARAILDPWHAEDPRPAARKLHLVCWSPADREPVADYHPRLTRIMENIRGFYAKEMERLGFGPRSVNLHYDKAGKLVIHLVKGSEPYANYNVQSGGKIRQECLPILQKAGLDPNRETIVIFCNMAEWDAEKLVFKHRSPYYAGGSHRQGTAWQLDSPELDTVHLSKTKPMMRDGQYGRISLGKHNSIFIGGITHELGHALGLPHNKERPDEGALLGTALMGSGNRTYGDELRKEGRGSFLTLAHGLRLASHPQFSGSVKGMSQRADVSFSDFTVKADGDTFRFSGTVTGSPPVYAVVGYTDPEGGGDYNATTATAVPDRNGRFTLHCRGLAKGKNATLRLVACHVNGAASSTNSPNNRFSFSYSVAKDGAPDLDSMQQRFALGPLIAAVNARDKAAMEDAFDYLHEHAPDGPGGETHRIGKRLVASIGEEEREAPADHAGPSVELAETTPAAVKVGWGRPTVNRVPKPSLLLESGGMLWEHGFYAHAPARHTFDLGGKWNKLTGSCGLADGHGGSVVFVVKADGKELWRSKAVRSGTVLHYSLDLAKAKQLELLVKDAGDGSGSDWGLWLEPVLGR